MLVMQVRCLLYHFIVTDPSTFWFQKHSPAMSIPLPPAAKITQFTIYLKFLFMADRLRMI